MARNAGDNSGTSGAGPGQKKVALITDAPFLWLRTPRFSASVTLVPKAATWRPDCPAQGGAHDTVKRDQQALSRSISRTDERQSVKPLRPGRARPTQSAHCGKYAAACGPKPICAWVTHPGARGRKPTLDTWPVKGPLAPWAGCFWTACEGRVQGLARLRVLPSHRWSPVQKMAGVSELSPPTVSAAGPDQPELRF